VAQRLARVRRAAGSRHAGRAAAIALVALWAAHPAAQDVQAPRAATATQAPANWFLAELPGTSEALSRAIGHETAVEPGRLMLEIVRLAQAAPATQDPNIDQARRQLVAYLDSVEQLQNAGNAAGTTVPTVRVPLPLSPDVWATRVFGRRVPVPRLGTAILRDRSAALLYYGLAALDAETLAYFSSSRGALEAALAFAPAFASYGRSLHVRNRRILLPGGEAATDSWEQLVGARASDPDRFVRRLLERDAGGLASFYDMAAHLDPIRLRFVLDFAEKDPGERRSRLRALYSACLGFDVVSKPQGRAFYRPSFDGGLLFRQLRLDRDGAMAPPAWRRLWELVFARAEIPRSPAGTLGDVRRDGAADAALLADLVLVPNPVIRRLRIETVFFAQRVFAGVSDDQMPDVLAALRGFVQFRTLMLTLERIGIDDAAVYAAAAWSASRFEDLGSGDRAYVVLAQFQGAIALIDRLTFRHSLSSQAAQTLVGTLLALVPSGEGGGYHGQIAQWLGQQVLPLLPASTGDTGTDTAEARLLGGLAGPRPANDGSEAQAIEWEGHRYRIDFATPEFERLRKIRRKQSDNSLDAALALSSAVSALTATGATLDSVRPASAELARLSRTLNPVFPGGAGGSDGRDPERAVTSAAEQLAGLTEPNDLRRAVEISRGLWGAADAVLADTLRSIAYAIALGDPDGLPLLGGNPATLHDFGLGHSLPDLRRRTPWMNAREVAGGGVPWHLAGSLLSLDLPLARLGLRRVSSEPPSGPPRVNPNDAQTLAHTVALMDPSDFTDADRELIVKAVQRGERRVAALADGGESADTVIAEAGLSEWRGNLLRWTLAHEPGSVPAAFSLTELFWLGRPDRSPEALRPWGVSSALLSGCLCLRFPPREPWDESTGHPSDGQLATMVPDLAVRIAQLLADLGLPAALVPAALVAATPDVMEEARLAGSDDWPTLVRFIRSISRDRAEEYLALLTAIGPLVPVSDEPGPDIGRRPPDP
jgi:hypothetical protein